MTILYHLIIENKEWIFSGIGVLVLKLLYNFFKKKKLNKNNIEKSIIKANQDIIIGDRKVENTENKKNTISDSTIISKNGNIRIGDN